MIDVVLAPAAGQDVDAGTEALLDKWLAGAGDRVRAGQPLASVVLVKATLEVVAPADGTLAEILVPAAATFGPGQPLARLAPAG